MSEMPQNSQTPVVASDTPPEGMGAKPYDIHKCAMDAEKALEKLATELAAADVDRGVVKSIGDMADSVREVATQMAHVPGPPAEPEGRPTMDSATNDLAAAAQRPAA